MEREDYRYKLQLPDGSYLEERLKLDYRIPIGSVIEIDGEDYKVECVGLVKGILYKVQLRELTKPERYYKVVRGYVVERVLVKVGRVIIWLNSRITMRTQ